MREAFVLSHVGEEGVAEHFGVDVDTARHWVARGADAPASAALWLRQQGFARAGIRHPERVDRIPRWMVWRGRAILFLRRMVRPLTGH